MKKVMIFSFGRVGGSVNYGREVINNLTCKKKIFISSYSTELAPKNAIKIITYKSNLTFIISSFTILPIFLIYLIFIQILNKYETIYFPYFHYWNYPIILLFKLIFTNVNIVSTVHDGISHIGDGKPLEQYLNIKCINLSSKLIFLTNFVENKIKNEINNNIDSYVFPHGLIIPKGINNNKRKFKKNMNILFLGRISIYKGVEYLIKAMSNLDSKYYGKLIIAGKQQYNLDIGGCKNIEVIDTFLEEERMSELINTSDILVLPYIEATQSGVITMGISGSIPMIITKVGGLEEQLNENEAYWIKPKDYKEIELSIKLLTKNQEIYEEYSSKLREKQTKLQWKQISNNILGVL